MAPPLLELSDVVVEFGGIVALNRVSLAVRPGEILGVIGPNGSGKTTLLNAVMGNYLPTSGEIAFEGRPLGRTLPHHRVRLGMARSFQHVEMFESLTVEEVVLLGLHTTSGETFLGALLRTPGFRRTARAMRERAAQLITSLGLGPIHEARIGTLPYGVRKMVDVARAVASEPRLVLLDEPCSGVSRAERTEILELVRRIQDRGTTLLLIEHDMSVVERLATRVAGLDFGVKIAEGSFEEVLANPVLQASYFAKPGHHQPPADVSVSWEERH